MKFSFPSNTKLFSSLMAALCLLNCASLTQAAPSVKHIPAHSKAKISHAKQLDSNATSKVIPNSIDLIVSDMQGKYEGLLDGADPYCNWQFAPRLNYGNDPTRGHYSTFQFWGIVYQEAGSELPANVRVHIRNIRAYYFSKRDHAWHLLQKDTAMNGLHYHGDFKGTPFQADTRNEADGGKSITMVKGFNYHFWPCCAEQKVTIDPTDIGGIFTTFQARLIMDNPNGPNNLAKARFMAQSGGDYWVYPLTGQGNPLENDDVGMGKFRFLKSEWQSFNMHSMTEAEIRKNPPPIE